MRLSVPYQKVLEAVNLSVPASTEAENPVVITCNTTHDGNKCDFFASLTEVTLTGPGMENGKKVMSGTSESVHEDLGYTISGNTLTLGKDLFKTAGQYSVTLKAGYGYKTQTVKFTITPKAEVPDQGNLTPPQVAEITKETGFGDSYYRISFSGDAEAYLNKVTSATVNGNAYELKNMFLGDNQFKVSKNDSAVATYLDFTTNGFNANGTTTVIVKATGYTDLSFDVTLKNGEPVTGGDSGETPGGDSEVTAKEPPTSWKAADYWGDYTVTSGMDHDDFIEAISAVVVNGTEYETGYVNSNNKYSTRATDGTITLGNGNMTSTSNVVVIKATGYKDLTLTIAADKKTVIATVGDSSGSGSTETPETPSEEGKEVPSYVGWNYYQLIFDQGGSNAEAATYLTKISKITIKNTTGETVLTESSSGWSLDATQYYKLSSGSDKYISFSSSAFSKTGDNIITIQADGYKDLTLTITNGNLKTDN